MLVLTDVAPEVSRFGDIWPEDLHLQTYTLIAVVYSRAKQAISAVMVGQAVSSCRNAGAAGCQKYAAMIPRMG